MAELDSRGTPSPPPFEDSETLLAILSGVQRRGQWEPAELVRVYAVMGGVDVNGRFGSRR